MFVGICLCIALLRSPKLLDRWPQILLVDRGAHVHLNNLTMCPGRVVAKHPSTTMLNSWRQVFVLICCISFWLNVELCIRAKQMQFCKLKPCWYVLFREKIT